MVRFEIGWGLLALLLGAIAAIILLTIRYRRYERRIARGSVHTKPVWKPFWL